jgi:isopropylmalate/homocitrate/citramalate synthase
MSTGKAFLNYPQSVTVYEVGPRDGLQNEKQTVPTGVKIEYINRLSASGLRYIEATSFVSPRAVPQLADAGQVMQGIKRADGVRYPVLVPNEKGMLRALEAGATDVAVFTAASESFTRANINMTIRESLDNFRPIMTLARQHGVQVRGYVSTAFGCPYEGAVPPARVREVTLALLDLGVWQVSIGDTIGVGTPAQVYEVVGVLLKEVPPQALAVHMHDTRGTALANVLVAMQMGITTVDSASGGLGGCPYAPGASGNLATEDLLYMLHGMGIRTGVDLDRVAEASMYLLRALGKQPVSKYLQAYMAGRQHVQTHAS